jgi:hypothetical protein
MILVNRESHLFVTSGESIDTTLSIIDFVDPSVVEVYPKREKQRNMVSMISIMIHVG